MKTLIIATALLFAPFAHASVPAPVAKAIANLKTNDVRTVITKGQADNPCELDYNVDLQVKTATLNHETMKTTYEWTTVKTISVDKHGRVMEVCGE